MPGRLPGEGVRRVVLPEPQPFLQKFFGSSSSSETKEQMAQKALADSLPSDVRRGLRYAALFDQMKRGESMLLNPIGGEAGPLKEGDELILLSRVFLLPEQSLPTDPPIHPAKAEE